MRHLNPEEELRAKALEMAMIHDQVVPPTDHRETLIVAQDFFHFLQGKLIIEARS
jgi:hypothetical protein